MNNDDDDPKKGSGRPPTRFKPHPENEPDAGEQALEHGDLPESAVPDPKLQADAKKGQQPGKSGQPGEKKTPDVEQGMTPDPENVG